MYESHSVNRDYSLNSIYQMIFVMVKCGVLFEVRTEFLHTLDEPRLCRVNTLDPQSVAHNIFGLENDTC
jgi:hypothetical protein